MRGKIICLRCAFVVEVRNVLGFMLSHSSLVEYSAEICMLQYIQLLVLQRNIPEYKYMYSVCTHTVLLYLNLCIFCVSNAF